MNQYSKENAFNRVVRNLENEPGIFNIEKEKGMDFNLTCILYNKVKLIFNLRADADILIIKGEAMYDGIESNELSNIGEMLFTNKEISCTAYENKLVIQSVVPLGDLGETDAMGKVVQKTNNFVGTVKSKLEELSDFNDLTSGAEAINDKKTSHPRGRRVISAQNAALLRAMLVQVVQQGTAQDSICSRASILPS